MKAKEAKETEEVELTHEPWPSWVDLTHYCFSIQTANEYGVRLGKLYIRVFCKSSGNWYVQTSPDIFSHKRLRGVTNATDAKNAALLLVRNWLLDAQAEIDGFSGRQ